MIRIMLLSAFFLLPISLEAMDQPQGPDGKFVLDDKEIALLHESLKIITPTQKILIEVLGMLSKDMYNELSNSPFEKWVFYCDSANSLGFFNLITKLLISIGNYHSTRNIEQLMDCAFWKSLRLFQFNKKELYVFKLILIRSLHKAFITFGINKQNINFDDKPDYQRELYKLSYSLSNLLSENQFLRERPDELLRPWDRILSYLVSNISQDASEESPLTKIKKIVKFDDSEITFKDQKISYCDITDVTTVKKDRQNLVYIREETAISEKFKIHKIKFDSHAEAELFVEHLNSIKDLTQMNKGANSENMTLLSTMYIAGLSFDNQPAKITTKRTRSKSIQPLKMQQISGGSFSSSSPKKDEAKLERRGTKADIRVSRETNSAPGISKSAPDKNTSESISPKGDSSRINLQEFQSKKQSKR